MGEVEVYIEDYKLELHGDEGINIKLNTQDINDISKVNAGYTKDWSVPASNDNNNFFKHYYNADITGGFDARTKKSASIFLKGQLFIKGKIRLTSTSLEGNKIVDYRVQFEGDVVNVKDVLGDSKLSDLDFSAYSHQYTPVNVKQGLTTSLASGSVVYPLISPVRRFYYDSTDTAANDAANVNTHYTAGVTTNAGNGIKYNELKPAIKVLNVIQEIASQNNLVFTGDFFNRDYLTKMFMWLSNNEGNMTVAATPPSSLVPWDGGGSIWVNHTTHILNIEWDDTFNDDPNDRFELITTIGINPAYAGVSYNYVVTIQGTGTTDEVEFFRFNDAAGTGVFNHFINRTAYPFGAEVRFYVESDEVLEYAGILYHGRTTYNTFPTVGSVIEDITLSSLTTVTGFVDIGYQMPDMKQIDFIIGIIKMFNIALTANDDGSIQWETLPDWYRKGKVFKGFEQYIDVDKSNIKRGQLNNEFKFEYQKPKTILAEQFNENTGVSYGDLEAKLYGANGELLDGGKLQIKLPFENMVYERMKDLTFNQLIDLQYGYAVDKNLKPVVSKAALFYNINGTVNSIGFVDDGGSQEEITTTINMPNHCISLVDNDAPNLNFGAEFSTYNYGVMNQSLYNQFHKDYVTDMFSNQRRVYNYDAYIPSYLLADIDLNDRLIIANRRYIINSINSNLITGKTKLELLNDIYTAGDLVGDSFYVTPNFMRVDNQSRTYTATVYSGVKTKISVNDEGFGVFSTLNSPVVVDGISTFNFTVDENISGLTRVMSFTLQNTTTSEGIKLFVEQTGGRITWDSNGVTLDNNIITFDSN